MFMNMGMNRRESYSKVHIYVQGENEVEQKLRDVFTHPYHMQHCKDVKNPDTKLSL